MGNEYRILVKKFLKQTPGKTSRKRYTDYDSYERPFPSMEIGDCFAYKYYSGKRIVVILDWIRLPGWKEQVLSLIHI